MQSVYSALATVLAYLLGSLSFGVLMSRAFGLPDPRTYGSRNPGATNVLRSGKKAAAVLTLLLDAAKGALPVVLATGSGARGGWARARWRWSAWPPSSATCGRCSSASRAARAWPPRPACCWP
jgi:glycerol-3-phosphate acyltransferase PlsY